MKTKTTILNQKGDKEVVADLSYEIQHVSIMK